MMDKEKFEKVEGALISFIVTTAEEKTVSEKAVEVLPETVKALADLERAYFGQ